MVASGSFGYKIGRKTRLMRVEYDSDYLWDELTRELYVLMKHFGSLHLLQEAFEQLNDAKGKPSSHAIERCKVFSDLEVSSTSANEWYNLTRHCQHSFINILESGYILNNGNINDGIVFLFDFNTKTARYYGVDWKNNVTEFTKATIDEIMLYENMPTKTYTEIVVEMNERYNRYIEQMKPIDDEIEKIRNIISKSKQVSDQNILTKAEQLLRVIEVEKMKVQNEYRVYYHRLDALKMIDI